MKGVVLSINVSGKKGVIKTPVDSVEMVENFGIKGDAHGGFMHRQVSFLADESVDKMRKMGAKGLKNGIFAENITTKGIILHELKVGTKLKIGESLHEVSQIGKKCHNDCEVKKLVGMCIMPTEGIFTKVLKSGAVKVGDEIEIVE